MSINGLDSEFDFRKWLPYIGMEKKGDNMKILRRGMTLAAVLGFFVCEVAWTATTVVADPTLNVPAIDINAAGNDSVIIVSSVGNPGDLPFAVKDVLGNPVNIAIGVDANGNTHSNMGTDYDKYIGVVFIRDTAVSGNFLMGNNAESTVFNKNLSIGKDLIVGLGTQTAVGGLTVMGTLAFTGLNSTVDFRSALARVTTNTLSLGAGTTLTVKDGAKSAFAVLEESDISGATVLLNGNAMAFSKGVIVGSGGVIKAETASEMYLGEYDAAAPGGVQEGVLTLAGGTLDGSDARLKILPKASGGGVSIADAKMLVTANSVIKGEVDTVDIDSTLQAGVTVHKDKGMYTWTVRNMDIQNGGVLNLGVSREVIDGGNEKGVVRLASNGPQSVLDVKSGGVIASKTHSFGMTPSGMFDKLDILNNNNVIGTGNAGKTPVRLTMQSGSTLDLSQGGLFLDGVNATLDGKMVFGGEQNGNPFALVGTNYTVDALSNVTYGGIGTVTIGNNASVVLTYDLASSLKTGVHAAEDANTLINLSGTYLGQQVGQAPGSLAVASGLLGAGNVIDMGFLGKFTLEADGSKLYVGKVERLFEIDGSVEGLNQFYDILLDRYGAEIGNYGLAANIYRLVSSADPDDPRGLGRLTAKVGEGNSFNMNSAFFNAILQQWVPAGEMSAVNMYTGANVGRVTSAILDNVAGRSNNLFRHAANRRNQLAFVAEMIGSDYGSASLVMDQEYLNRFYVTPYGRIDSANGRSGFDGYHYEGAGVNMGYDRTIGQVMMGVEAGFSKGDFEDKSALDSESRMSHYSLGAYGTYAHETGLFATIAGGYTYSDNDIKERRRQYVSATEYTDMWNTGDYYTGTWHIGAELGIDYKVNDSFTISPSVGFTYIDSRAENHHEEWGGVSVGAYNNFGSKATLLPVRVQADYQFGCGSAANVILSGNVGYTHNFYEDDFDGKVWLSGFNNPTSIHSTGRRWGKNTLNLGVGLRVEYNRIDFNINYDYYRKAGFNANYLQAMLGVNF